ncbi:hypothetical protein [Georgenia muralis]|uniref:DUF91 domain-containing protein n=1 Tax=Georgenia muralis TaxID=154117 RepID=A0A3N4ZAB7_9MICO|nr:hypothetical protein [Georgenia muralis]RPF29014.1 hypothetical protein EDD32_3566 [Georgenia muralis]
MPVAVWSVGGNAARRLEQRQDWVEAQLEAWVKHDPTMIAPGLRWLGQQVIFPDRSRLDLLGLSQEGGIVLAELKRGPVDVATLSQALHYVLWLGSMDPDDLLGRLRLSGDDAATTRQALQNEGAREISIVLIGTGRAPELDQAVQFLVASGFTVPVSIVTFTSFVDPSGAVFLTRETEDHQVAAEDVTPRQQGTRRAKVEWVLEQAREHGVQDAFQDAIALAGDLGLRIKPWPNSITVVPPFTHGRTLLYLSPTGPGQVELWFSEEALAELYGADETDVREAVGPNGNYALIDARQRVRTFAEIMNRLLAAKDPDRQTTAGDQH